MYTHAAGASGTLAMTGLVWANNVLAGVVLIALGLTVLALVPRKKGEWRK